MRWSGGTLLTAMILGCFAAGCGKKSSTDQTLTTGIQAKLYADAITKTANVNVSANHGVVTLSGSVPSADVELEAMKIANATPGVRSVKDQLQVNSSTAGSQVPSAPSAVTGSYPSVSSPPMQPSQTSTSAPQAQPAPQAQVGPATSGPSAAIPVVTIPRGTHVSVRMIDSINSAHNTTGQVFRGSLSAPIIFHRTVVVPAGANVSILLTDARGAGRIKGRSQLEVRLSALDYHGRRYPVDSSVYEESGKARGKQSAERTGAGAVAGAIIGAIAGGGKGAAIGTVAGGGAGAGYQLFTHGQQVKIPSESVLTFRLEAPLTFEPRR